MSNQASEDDLRAAVLTEFKQVHKLAPDDYTENCTNIVMSIIRTEKLKLLAEVRERVVGEPIPHDWDDDIDDMTKWKYYTGYKSNADDFVAGYNRSRAERLEQLTKLEAEL